MIYSEQNDRGVISFNKSIMSQLISDAFKSWTSSGKLKLSNQKIIAVSEDGIYICLHFSLAMGESISSIADHALSFLSSAITDSLQMEIDDIVLILDNMYTSKGSLAERNMRFSYREGSSE